MHKLKAKALTALLLVTMIMAFIPLVEGSTGYITINVLSPGPSTPGQMVPAGGVVNLHFGGVGWSGGQFYLLMSTDGFSQVSTGDLQYTPTFLLTDLTGAPKVINGTGGAQWTIGNNWVNGSVASGIAGGNYFIKAFDGTATSVAVTDTYITVIGAIKVVPGMGPGGQTINVTGSAFLANGYVNLSYYNQYLSPAAWVTVENYVSCDALGAFQRTLNVVDFKQVLPGTPDPDLVTFMAMENGTGRNATAQYSEYRRRLLQVGTLTGTIGNATVTGLNVGVFQSLFVAGNYFHPGSISLSWDGTSVLATTTANQTGFFNTSITVPVTPIGPHNIVVTDANLNFVVTVTVTTTLVLTPNSGNVGITVTVEGYGYTPSTATMTYNATVWWGATALAWGLVDTTGYFMTSITVPKAPGGSNQVMGLENDTAATSANATFTITPKLVITPDTFANDGTLLVQVIGTGLNPSLFYAPNIDNQLIGINSANLNYPTDVIANSTGDIELKFVGVGFRPGVHVFSLYASPGASPAINVYTPVWATFTVTADGDFVGDTLATWEPVILGIADTLATWEPVILGMSATLDTWEPVILGIADTLATWEPVILGLSDSVNTLLGITTVLDTWEPVILGMADSVTGIESDLADNLPLTVDMTPVWIAVVLSLVAALAAIYAVITIRQKIAG